MLTKNNLSIMIIAMVFVSLAVTSYSCSTGIYLKTESATEKEITGVYTLILYGGSFVNDVKTFAILAKEGTRYSFEVFAPEFDYQMIKGVPAKEALEKAGKFVSFHHNFWKVQLSRIVDDGGSTIGYEVRPLYYPLIHNKSDILDVYYKKSDGKIIVYIRFYGYPDTMFPFEGGRMSSPK